MELHSTYGHGATERTILKGFAEVDGRLIHYVRSGSGPALVMLHAAPCSSKVMAPLQAAWFNDFTTFAFDLPGFGLSDPLPPDGLETAHLADAIAEATRSIGLERFALYGRHTGAGVAVELAKRHPSMCSMVLTDGFPVFPNPYTEDRLKEYLPPIEPKWDGSHLTWAWFRYREQHIFWPWDRPFIENRADTDIPSLDFLYRGAVELLEAAPNYAAVYATAFRHPGLSMINEVSVPVCYGNRPGDSQFKTLERYPPQAWTQVFPRDPASAAAAELELLKAHVEPSHAPPYRSRFLDDARSSLRDYITTSSGATYARGEGLDRAGTPVFLLHDLPGSADLHAEELVELGRERPAVSFDFVGNCHSAGNKTSVEYWVQQLDEVASALGYKHVHLYAHGTSAAVAVEYALRRPTHVSSVIFRSPPAGEFSASDAMEYAPDISPSWDGGNFLKLWHHLRDQELWSPWFKRSIKHARGTPPQISPPALQRRAMVMLRQPQNYAAIWQAVLEYPLLKMMRDLEVRCSIISYGQDLFCSKGHFASAALNVPLELIHTSSAAGYLSRWLHPN